MGAREGHAVHMRVVDESVCDRLLLTNKITLAEHIICEKLYGQLRRASFSKMPASKLEPSSGGHDPHASLMTDSMVEINKLFSYMDKMMGQKVRNMVTNIVLDIRPVYGDTELELFRTSLLLLAIKWEKKR